MKAVKAIVSKTAFFTCGEETGLEVEFIALEKPKITAKKKAEYAKGRLRVALKVLLPDGTVFHFIEDPKKPPEWRTGK